MAPIDIASILSSWEAIGVFDYALPFLLILFIVMIDIINDMLDGKENPWISGASISL